MQSVIRLNNNLSKITIFLLGSMIILSIVGLFAAKHAYAEPGPASGLVSGHVNTGEDCTPSSEWCEPVKGATVKISSSTVAEQVYETEEDGGFRFDDLSFGHYDLTVSAKGYDDYHTILDLNADNYEIYLDIILDEESVKFILPPMNYEEYTPLDFTINNIQIAYKRGGNYRYPLFNLDSSSIIEDNGNRIVRINKRAFENFTKAKDYLVSIKLRTYDQYENSKDYWYIAHVNQNNTNSPIPLDSTIPITITREGSDSAIGFDFVTNLNYLDASGTPIFGLYFDKNQDIEVNSGKYDILISGNDEAASYRVYKSNYSIVGSQEDITIRKDEVTKLSVSGSSGLSITDLYLYPQLTNNWNGPYYGYFDPVDDFDKDIFISNNINYSLGTKFNLVDTPYYYEYFSMLIPNLSDETKLQFDKNFTANVFVYANPYFIGQHNTNYSIGIYDGAGNFLYNVYRKENEREINIVQGQLIFLNNESEVGLSSQSSESLYPYDTQPSVPGTYNLEYSIIDSNEPNALELQSTSVTGKLIVVSPSEYFHLNEGKVEISHIVKAAKGKDSSVAQNILDVLGISVNLP